MPSKEPAEDVLNIGPETEPRVLEHPSQMALLQLRLLLRFSARPLTIMMPVETACFKFVKPESHLKK